MRIQHWSHQIRCSGGGTTATFAFINTSCASPVPACVETGPRVIRCSPPDGGIPVDRRSKGAFEAQRIEPVLRCDPAQIELASCTCGNGRRDTSECRRILTIEKYA